MNKIIKTETVTKNFAKTSGVLLDQTSLTALVFFPEIHPGGVRGHLIRFRKNKNESWDQIQEEDFRKLKTYEGVHIELGTAQLLKLCEEVEVRKSIIDKNGIQPGEMEYVIAEKNSVIEVNDVNIKNVLIQLLKHNYTEEFWSLLQDEDPALLDTLIAGRLQLTRKRVLEELQERLTKNFPESNGSESWQSWIYKNSWLFGANYQKPIEKQKINLHGIMPDYLFPTIDDFIDILEIKLPTFEVIEEDLHHKGSWIWSKETNKAIGQVVTYLCEMERLRLEIEKVIKSKSEKDILMIKPRAFILIGNCDGWHKEKKEGLRKLNHALHGIEILTYSDLMKRGQTFVASTEV